MGLAVAAAAAVVVDRTSVIVGCLVLLQVLVLRVAFVYQELASAVVPCQVSSYQHTADCYLPSAVVVGVCYSTGAGPAVAVHE